MIELKSEALMFRFTEVHADARCRIDFQRTLRISDDNRDYPLPPEMVRWVCVIARPAVDCPHRLAIYPDR